MSKLNTMTHTYTITGMSCSSCEAKVKSSLLMLPDVTAANVSKKTQSATISMSKHISLAVLQQTLDKKYTISPLQHNEAAEQAKSWLSTYKPILLIFVYITGVAVIAGSNQHAFHWMPAMNIFMSGFFLTFSFFKMLDLKGFAESYAMYDVVAKKIKAWGYVYVFIELLLGIAYAINFNPVLTNIVTIIVMAISSIGVLQSVLNKRAIRCACLGAVFNLPMSTVTIIEGGLMIAMSTFMLMAVI